LGDEKIGNEMNFLIWIAVGGIVGWFAGIVMKNDKQRDVLQSVVVGAVGAFFHGLVVSPWVGVTTVDQNSFSLGAMLVAMAGAVVLLAIVSHLPLGSSR
jgi:uncharacterized membrane protein YeaQ/YmgE (transglycosylase-associated protein family)